MHKGLVLDFGTGKGQDAIRSVVRSLLALGPASNPAVRRTAAERVIADAMIDAEQRGHLYGRVRRLLRVPARQRARRR